MPNDLDEHGTRNDAEERNQDVDAGERAALINDIRAGLGQMTPEQLARLRALLLVNLGGREGKNRDEQ